jgi:hypothetical protein
MGIRVKHCDSSMEHGGVNMPGEFGMHASSTSFWMAETGKSGIFASVALSYLPEGINPMPP